MLYEKEIQQKKSIKALKSFVCVILASCLMAFNIKTFVRAGELVPGGITGMTLLIQRIMLKYANISVPYSVLNISLNAIPAIIGFKLISKRFTGYSVLMIVLNSFLVDLIPSYKVTTDPLLIALFAPFFPLLKVKSRFFISTTFLGSVIIYPLSILPSVSNVPRYYRKALLLVLVDLKAKF